MTQRQATLIGATAVLMWGLLALFTTKTGKVPPFQLAALSFAVAALLTLVKWAVRREDPRPYLAQPPGAWVLGVGGLFGYHFFYFMALKNAPVVDASLIAYLWPLLIVVFSALLPGERLGWHHLTGALLGFSGSAILILRGGGLGFDMAYATGYAAAIGCALTWSSYSVLSRKFGHIPTDAVGGFCAATAFLGFVCHLAFEQTITPADSGVWLAILGLGLGPVGLAFFAWDVGVKRGNIRVLGAASYCAPLLSTLLLTTLGDTELTWRIALACLLIVAGAVLAAKDILRRQT